MTQASVNIQQQFKDGGVVPADLSGQSAVSKKYVDDQLAIRDENISIAQNAANGAQSDINNHLTSMTAHAAQQITYSGPVNGSNVKQALDSVNGRISEIVSQAGDDNTEIVDARGGFLVLGDRLNNLDANTPSKYLDVLKFGAIGDGVADDTDAFNAAVQAAITQGKILFIPRSSNYYRITGTIVIDQPITVESDAIALIQFYLPDNNTPGIMIKSPNHGKYSFPRMVGNGFGIGLQVNSTSVTNVYYHLITSFDVGFHLLSLDSACLDNTVSFDFNANCRAGVKIETRSPSFSIEGNRFEYNFITNCQYGIEVLKSPQTGGAIVYNTIEGTAIHSTWELGACIYGKGLEASTMTVKGFLGANNGVAVGGPTPFGGVEGYFDGNKNTFDLYIDTGKVNVTGTFNVFKNLNNIQNANDSAPGIPVSWETDDMNTWNGGTPLYSNKSVLNAVLNPAAEGAQFTAHVYHDFCSHGQPKAAKIIYRWDSIPTDFIISPRDVSYANNKRIDLIFTYTKQINVQKTVYFYLEFE